MAEIMRMRVGWSGWNGGPGVSTFYASGTDPAPLLKGIDTFFANLTTYVPSGIIFTVYGGGDIIESTTGVLTGQWQHQADVTHTCSGNGNYAAAAGCQIRWNTSTIHSGRRLAGRTFLVPLTSANFDGTGQVNASTSTSLTTGANQLISDSLNSLVVWGRPKGGAGGLAGEVTTANVPRKDVVLRSRRD